MLLTQAVAAAETSATFAGTAVEWVWLVPLLPLLGFVINGALSLFSATRFGPADPSAAHTDAGHEGHAAAGAAPSA